MNQQHVNTKWAAERLGVSGNTVCNLRRRGVLVGVQEGTGATAPWRFDRRSVEQLADSRAKERRARAIGQTATARCAPVPALGRSAKVWFTAADPAKKATVGEVSIDGSWIHIVREDDCHTTHPIQCVLFIEWQDPS